jgi:alpha,alpha-trehalase
MWSSEEANLLEHDPLELQKKRAKAWWVIIVLVGVGICALVAVPTYIYAFEDNSSNDRLGVCAVLCGGPILEAVQTSKIFFDSKTFVDMPLLYDPEDIIADFNNLPDHSPNTLEEFVARNFLPAGSDVQPWVPPDWIDSPSFLDNIANPAYKEWAYKVNQLWELLGRQVDQDVYENPQRHTLLQLKHPYMMVPGGRFREFYYWDTYWIIKGLLVCEMNQTAKIVLENLLDLVDKHGFVPNGNRQYYLTRSQPPYLTLMVKLVAEALGDVSIVENALPILEKEYRFWMEGKRVLTVADSTGVSHQMNRYYAEQNSPRPESFIEDEETAHSAANPSQLYKDIAAAAESGWDFSSRWFSDKLNINTSVTTQIIPVDLNAVMCGVESTLSSFFTQVGNVDKANKYTQAFKARKEALSGLLWDQTSQRWRDLNVQTMQQSDISTIASYIPLWTACFDSEVVNVDNVVESLMNSNLSLPGGLATTLEDTPQQWDMPNAWPPLQHMIIEALDNIATPTSQAFALNVTQQWLYSGWLAWNRTNVMYEKYLVTEPGQTGFGGEYIPQTGFGWTNGVLFGLLQRFGSQM